MTKRIFMTFFIDDLKKVDLSKLFFITKNFRYNEFYSYYDEKNGILWFWACFVLVFLVLEKSEFVRTICAIVDRNDFSQKFWEGIVALWYT